jgi:hypothetical protein
VPLVLEVDSPVSKVRVFVPVTGAVELQSPKGVSAQPKA